MYSLSEIFVITTMITVVTCVILSIVKNKKDKHYNFVRGFFAFLLIFVVSFIITSTIIPKIEVTAENTIAILKPYSHSERINLIPFSFFRDIKFSLDNGLYYNILFNIIGNIVPFSALSFLGVFLFEKYEKLKSILICCALFSIAIELIQIPLYRGCDIDDLILNMIGYGFGCLIAKMIIRKYPLIISKIRKKG